MKLLAMIIGGAGIMVGAFLVLNGFWLPGLIFAGAGIIIDEIGTRDRR